MNSQSQTPSTSKTTGKLRFILNQETATASAPAKPKTTGKVRFNVNPETPSTSKSSGRPKSVVPRTTKNIQKYNKKRQFDIHIHRLMKVTRTDNISISRDAIDVLNTFCMDIMDRISKEANDLLKYNKTSTLGIREIKSATKLVLSTELAKYGIIDANKAWKKYTDSKIIVVSANEDPTCHCTYIC